MTHFLGCSDPTPLHIWAQYKDTCHLTRCPYYSNELRKSHLMPKEREAHNVVPASTANPARPITASPGIFLPMGDTVGFVSQTKEKYKTEYKNKMQSQPQIQRPDLKVIAGKVGWCFPQPQTEAQSPFLHLKKRTKSSLRRETPHLSDSLLWSPDILLLSHLHILTLAPSLPSSQARGTSTGMAGI